MVRDKPDNPAMDAPQRRPAERLHMAPDIGNEPPLNPGGISAPRVDRRAVSPRWFSGAVLTGVSGVALIGSAIYVSLESDASVLRTPEMVNASYRASGTPGEAPVVSTRRADRLVRFEITPGARQNFKSPMTLRVGAMEVIKVRNFVRVASPLAMSTGQYATDIPQFNPLQMFTDNSAEPEREAQPEPDVADAEVSLVKTSLTGAETFASSGLSESEAAAQIRQLRTMAAKQPAVNAQSLPLPPQLLLSRSLRQFDSGGEAGVEGGAFGQASDAPFSRIEVHVIPENLTVLPKATQDAAQASDEELVTLKKDETLEAALRARGADDEQIRGILRAIAAKMRIGAIGEGNRLRILVAPAPVAAGQTSTRRQIVRVMVIGANKVEAIAALDDRGVFVAIEPENETTQNARASQSDDDDDNSDSGAPRLYASLYETGLKNGLTREMVADLIRIFAYDFDLERHISPGDRLEVFFAEDEEGGSPEMLFASLTVNGETRSVYRYQGPDGTVEYFDRDGKSLKKFLLRKPISEGILRSGFGMRHHPILGYSKMHTGVDWANKVGTPILAAGDGLVAQAGWHSGYGRHTEIQHTNGYVTTYSHQSAFAKGIKPGIRVRQGQVIGYLGSSGLSTGPHLHYEVLINGRFVNPMRIKVPRGGELDGAALAEFRRRRQQTDELMEKADGPRVATAAPASQPQRP
ncbi:membrane protein [Camelimonas fluminis]|uniref:M23 family metallopeptidase n=1 Tax=Camelimonas fluminis TaxID=1576911 RepID=A0ABV7UNG7_9HYPH|nr:M23 family metallopeptidase [Camelimonas fluminis]GHE68936.1 membrane protein [Camelimonas fluminis]